MSTFKLCPACGSIKIEGELLLDDSQVKCQSCTWVGTSKDLILHELDENRLYAIATEVAMHYLRELARLAAEPIGEAMISSNIVDKSNPSLLARLIRASIFGAHKATLIEIYKIQGEISHDKPS